MQAECDYGHPLSCVARMVVRWCPECARFEVRVYAQSSAQEEAVTLIPEWAHVLRLPDDEYRDRTLTKYMTGMVQTVRTLEDDERGGVMRLPL